MTSTLSTKQRRLLLLVACFLLLGASLALARPGGVAQPSAASGYDLSWWTVDGGGANAQVGGVYLLGGTAGQPDAATWQGGGYTLGGGFWFGPPAAGPLRVYLPMILR